MNSSRHSLTIYDLYFSSPFLRVHQSFGSAELTISIMVNDAHPQHAEAPPPNHTFCLRRLFSPTYKLNFEGVLDSYFKRVHLLPSLTQQSSCASLAASTTRSKFSLSFLGLPLRGLFALLSNHLAHHRDAPLPHQHLSCTSFMLDKINNIKRIWNNLNDQQLANSWMNYCISVKANTVQL